MEGSEKKSEENVLAEIPNMKVNPKRKAEVLQVVDLTSPKSSKAVEGPVVETSSSSTDKALSPPNGVSENHSLHSSGTKQQMTSSAQLLLTREAGSDAVQQPAVMPRNNDDASETKYSDRQTTDANGEIPKSSSPIVSQEKTAITIVSSFNFLVTKMVQTRQIIWAVPSCSSANPDLHHRTQRRDLFPLPAQ